MNVPSGDYTCQITQVNDPEADDPGDDATHFILTLTTSQAQDPWSSPAWCQPDW